MNGRSIGSKLIGEMTYCATIAEKQHVSESRTDIFKAKYISTKSQALYAV